MAKKNSTAKTAMKNTITKKDIQHIRKHFVYSPLRLVICAALLAVLIAACYLFPVIPTSFYADNAGAPLQFHMIDVGSADALVLELPDQKVMMIDCGYSITASDNYDYNTIENYLTDHIVEKGGIIDYIVNTHPDSDHYNGFKKLLDNYEIKNIYLPYVNSDKTALDDESPSPFIEDNSTYAAFVNTAYAEQGAQIFFANQNTPKIVGNENGAPYTFSFYAPNDALASASNSGSHTNRISTMMTLEYGNQILVFTGDAEGQTESLFMSNIPDANTNGIGDIFENKQVYLKVAHHGTDTQGSSGQAFIDFIRPQYAFISAGPSYDKSDGTIMHPSEATLAKLLVYCGNNIYTTRFVGNVTATLDTAHIYINGENTAKYFYLIPIYGVLAIIVVILCFYHYNNESRRNAEQKKKEKK